jgi:hypothetical protein
LFVLRHGLHFGERITRSPSELPQYNSFSQSVQERAEIAGEPELNKSRSAMQQFMGKSWRELLSAAMIAAPIVFPVSPPSHETRFSIFPVRAMPQSEALVPMRLVASDNGAARLVLGFADRSGSYLGNVRVLIVNESGDRIIANMISEGPWLELQIDPGVYDVKAVFQGEEQELRGLQLAHYDQILRVLYWDLNVPPTQMQARSVGTTA